MKYISHSGNPILIGHFPGQCRSIENNIRIIEETMKKKVHVPDNITIVSPITENTLNNSPLPIQLNNSGIDYINPLLGKNVIWRPHEKIKYVLDGLKEVKTEYTLIMDGNDAVIMDDLDTLIDKYKTYNKDIIYNATCWRFPQVIVDYVEDRYKYGIYNYLNAGICIGKTESLIPFYQEAWDIAKYDGKNPYHSSEQYYIRKVFDKYQDTVFFDYDCRFFQIWHKASYKYSADGKTCQLL